MISPLGRRRGPRSRRAGRPTNVAGCPGEGRFVFSRCELSLYAFPRREIRNESIHREMNPELTSLIRLCLNDGVLTEKELKVIHDKAQSLGISEAECEVIIDSLKIETAEPVQPVADIIPEPQPPKSSKRPFEPVLPPESKRPMIDKEAELQSDVDKWEMEILRTVDEEYQRACNNAMDEFSAHQERYKKLKDEVRALDGETAKAKKATIEAAADEIKKAILDQHKCQVLGKFQVSSWLNSEDPDAKIKDFFLKAQYDMSSLQSSAALKGWGVLLLGVGIIVMDIWLEMGLHWGGYSIAIIMIWYGNKRRKQVTEDWQNSSDNLQLDEIGAICDKVLGAHSAEFKKVKSNEGKLKSAETTLKKFKLSKPKYKVYS